MPSAQTRPSAAFAAGPIPSDSPTNPTSRAPLPNSPRLNCPNSPNMPSSPFCTQKHLAAKRQQRQSHRSTGERYAEPLKLAKGPRKGGTPRRKTKALCLAYDTRIKRQLYMATREAMLRGTTTQCDFGGNPETKRNVNIGATSSSISISPEETSIFRPYRPRIALMPANSPVR